MSGTGETCIEELGYLVTFDQRSHSKEWAGPWGGVGSCAAGDWTDAGGGGLIGGEERSFLNEPDLCSRPCLSPLLHNSISPPPTDSVQPHM